MHITAMHELIRIILAKNVFITNELLVIQWFNNDNNKGMTRHKDTKY